MNLANILNQVMSAGSELAKQSGQSNSDLGSQLNKTNSGLASQFGQAFGNMSDMTKGTMGGALGGSLITMLLGSKKGRKMGGSLAQYGGAAALGAIALKVFDQWQSSNQATQANQPVGQSMPTPQAANQQLQAESLTAESGTELEQQHAMLILKTIIAAAKSDGHVSEDERAKINQVISTIDSDPQVARFVENEINKPLDPNDIAKSVVSQDQAAEVYLTSYIMIDEQSFMEKAYLDALAQSLHLAPELVAQLESSVTK